MMKNAMLSTYPLSVLFIHKVNKNGYNMGTAWLWKKQIPLLVQSALYSRANALDVSALCLPHNLNAIVGSDACQARLTCICISLYPKQLHFALR